MDRHGAHDEHELQIGDALVGEHRPARDREELVTVGVCTLEAVLRLNVVDSLGTAIRAGRVSIRPSRAKKKLPATVLAHPEDFRDAERAARRVLQPMKPLLLALEWFDVQY